jgi:hypothetical protein
LNSLRTNGFRAEDRENGVSQAFRGSVMAAGARGVVVNRTHRVVREQALNMQEQKQKSRSLWVPLGIFSILMIVICYAIWGMMDGYDAASNGIPDASDQLMMMLAWSLPVTSVVLGLVWFKRVRRADGEAPR